MPIHPIKRIEDKTRDLVMLKDYGIYLLFNLFKYKKFPKKVRRILVVELLRIGDVLVATPTIRALKEKFKEAEIDILVIPEMQEVLKTNPHLNQIIPHTSYNATKKILTNNNYDLAIILHPGSFKISKLLLNSKIKYRVGCAKSGIRYGKGFFLNKKVVPNNKWQHKIEDNLDVVRAIDVDTTNKAIELPIEKVAKKKIDTLLKKQDKKLIGIHAPSLHRTQQWIPERFAEVADRLVKKHKAAIIFTGTKEEIPYINKIISMTQQKQKMLNLAGKTNLQEYIAVIAKLDLLISVDTGAIHIASATKTPTVALFGPTMPPFWGPSYKKSSIIWKEKGVCVGCRKYTCIFNKDYECMRSITVEDVMAEVKKLW